MVIVDIGSLIAFAVWFALVVGVVMPLASLIIVTAIHGRPTIVPEPIRPEVTVYGSLEG